MTNDAGSHAAVRIALLTPPGRGALAVVGIAGPGACQVADACFQPRGVVALADRSAAAICFGTWVSQADGPGEDLVVVKHSAVRLEVHCHGGHAASEAVLASLERQGAMRQLWPDWLAGTGMDPIEIEARQAMSRVAGARAARILARQALGVLSDAIARLASLPPGDRAASIQRMLAASRVGLRLTDPWRVVLAGPVNAGKSSLANALAGYSRSIVSPEPGTTRDLVTTRLVLGGFEVELFDTAGLREREATTTNTERAGIERAERAAIDADLVLRVFPADEARHIPLATGPTDLLVMTKADLAPSGFKPPDGCVMTSASNGHGIAKLIDTIVARLMPALDHDPTLLDGPVPFTERQVAVIRHLAEEHQ